MAKATKLAKVLKATTERTMTMAQAGEALGVSRSRVYALAKAQRLETRKVSGRTVVAAVDVENLHLELLDSSHPSEPLPALPWREMVGAPQNHQLERLERLERQEADYALESDGTSEGSLEPALLALALALAAIAAVRNFSLKPSRKQPLAHNL